MTEHNRGSERIRTDKWYESTCKWNSEAYYDATAVVSPSRAQALHADSWEITVTLGDISLKSGDHLAVEVNTAWTLDRGRPFLYGRVALHETWSPGYQATPTCEFPKDVEYSIGITPAERFERYFIIDVVITVGQVSPGGSFKIYLANPQGSLLRCPWFARLFYRALPGAWACPRR